MFLCLVFMFFFFKQKTAYEMRISDWSSDVCSSDLLPILGRRISAGTVSQVAKILDAAVGAFHRRPVADRYPVLMLDGVVLSRKTGAGALRRPVLVDRKSVV